MAHRIGTKVRLVTPVIEGVVQDAVYDAKTGRFRYLVPYVANNEGHERWFDQDEIEVVPAEEKPE